MTARQKRILLVLLSIIVVILAVAALRATQVVAMPLVFAFFVTVLVWPIHRWVQCRVSPGMWWLGVVAAMAVILLGLGLLGGAAWLIAHQIAADTELLEQYRAQWQLQWENAQRWLEERGLPSPGNDDNQIFVTQLVDWLKVIFQTLAGFIVALVLIFFFTLLMLVEADHWRRKSEKAMGGERAAKLFDAIVATMRQVRTFLIVQALVASITATATGLWIWFMGVPFVLLWTLLTFLVDFVPNIGPTIAVALVSIIALVTLGWGRAIITSLGLLVIQQFFGNYVHPMIAGHRMTISPLIVLLSVVFWAWLWGPGGAVIAVPITATIIIACAHVPVLRPIALMLSRTADVREMMKQTQGNQRE